MTLAGSGPFDAGSGQLRRFQRSDRRAGQERGGPGILSPDMTPRPDLGQGHALAGPVRTHRPLYVDLLPPCNSACPAGENIQGWLAHMTAGEPERAWRLLV